MIQPKPDDVDEKFATLLDEERERERDDLMYVAYLEEMDMLMSLPPDERDVEF